MAQVRPSCLSSGQSLGGHSSTDFMPSAAACRANSSTGIGLKHQGTTDWLIRPLATFQWGSSCGDSAAAACDKTAPLAAMVPSMARLVSLVVMFSTFLDGVENLRPEEVSHDGPL